MLDISDANRILDCEHRAGFRERSGLPRQESERRYADHQRRFDFATKVGEMRRTPAAALWAAVYPALTSDHPGLVGKLLAIARSETNVARPSALYALLAQAEETFLRS